MSLANSLSAFQANALQCEALIANAHQLDGTGAELFPVLDRSQITVAAFLNLFVAWEGFLEETFAKLMVGNPTISGGLPIKYVSPQNEEAARLLVIGVQRYFDYANHENVRRIARMYFDNGHPYEPHLSAINSDLADLRTMRNASAHISSTTQSALESLAQRIFSTPRPGIDLYSMLTAIDPRSASRNTVFAEYQIKLLTVATLIATG